MKIDIFVPAWRPRSVSEMYSERVASILLCFALLCTALLCVAPLGFALLRLVWGTGTNDGMRKGSMTISEIPQALPAAQEGPQAVISAVFKSSHILRANGLVRGGRQKSGLCRGVPYPSFCRAPLPGWRELGLGVLEGARNRGRKGRNGKEGRDTDPEKSWGTCFRARFPYEIRYFRAGWAAQKRVGNGFRKGCFHLALFCVALHWFALRCSALLRFASLGVGNWDE